MPPLPGSRFLLAACVVMLLTAIAHTIAQLAPQPEPEPEDLKTLMRLATQYRLPDLNRTMMELFDGFGWWFSLSTAIGAMAAITVRRLRPSDAGLLRVAIVWLLALEGIGLAISLRYWFIVPTSFIGAATALLLVALVRSRGASAA